jgi:tyrosyl-tRNA synthetase
VDQRKIFALAKDVLPRIGYKERAHLVSVLQGLPVVSNQKQMNAMVPGLQGGKMSASDANSKIDILDDPEVVTKKLKKAEAVPKKVDGNGLLSFIEFVLLPAGSLKHGTPYFRVDRRDAEPLEYSEISKINADYEADVLTPQLLKPAITTALIELLAPVQAEFKASKEWQEIEKKAYPPPVEVKKEKKVKNKGSKYPGGAKPEVEKPEQEVIEDMEKLKVDAMKP